MKGLQCGDISQKVGYCLGSPEVGKSGSPKEAATCDLLSARQYCDIHNNYTLYNIYNG